MVRKRASTLIDEIEKEALDASIVAAAHGRDPRGLFYLTKT